jgi:hypothetical protein
MKRADIKLVRGPEPRHLMSRVFHWGCVSELYCGHETTFSVIQDVAMHHPGAGTIVKSNQ